MGSRQHLAGRPIPGTVLAWCTALARAAAGAGVTVLAGLLFWALVPLATGWHTDVVLSGSMQPQISPGDLVIVAPGTKGIHPGQVIAFRDPAHPGRQLVHRVVQRNTDGTFTTRGDANPSADSTPVPLSNVDGLARLRIPWLGLPVYWLRQGVPPSPTALVVLIVYLLAILPYHPPVTGRHRGEGRASRGGGRHRAVRAASVASVAPLPSTVPGHPA
jgi:signal peptidase I